MPSDEIKVPDNQAVATVNSIIHRVIMDVAFNAAMADAIAAAPWLKLPVVNQIFTALAKYVFGFIDQRVEQAASFAIIDNQTGNELSAYNEAVQALIVAQAQGDADALQKATDDFKTTLAHLIHTNGK